MNASFAILILAIIVHLASVVANLARREDIGAPLTYGAGSAYFMALIVALVEIYL